MLVLLGCSNDADSSDRDGPPSTAASTDTRTPETTEDIDVTGHWQLTSARLSGDQFLMPPGVNFALTVRDVVVDEPSLAPQGTTAFASCAIVSLEPLVDGDAVSFAPGDEPVPDLDCLQPRNPSPIRAVDYFKALDDVDHAERSADTLVLTGPDVVLTYEREDARSVSDLEVLVAEPSAARMTALMSGELKAVGGCLGVGDSVVVWPSGTVVVDSNPLAVDVPNYGTFNVDDEIEIGGGFVLEHSSDKAEPGDVPVAGTTVPARCAKHDIWLAG